MTEPHKCKPPQLTLMGGRQLWWECATCGRVWQPVYSGAVCWWEETRGPVEEAEG